MTTTLPCNGGWGGDIFDDGVNDDVRKVIVGEDSDGIAYIRIEYMKDGTIVQHQHGRNTGIQTETTFELNYPEEYITLIEGTTRDDIRADPVTWVHGDDPTVEEIEMTSSLGLLQFTTSTGRTSKSFGKAGTPGPLSCPFVLKGKSGTKLAGLHGRSSDFVDSLGAHFVTHLVPPVKKLEAVGEDLGIDWDDGVHEDVHKITISFNGAYVESIQFDYVVGDPSEGYQTVEGDEHTGAVGVVSSKKEYYFEGTHITSIDGFYGQKTPPWFERPEGCQAEETYITMLNFNTTRGSIKVGNYVPYYEYFGKSFRLEEVGHKIVGFHGKSGHCLQKLGVYVKPIANTTSTTFLNSL